MAQVLRDGTCSLFRFAEEQGLIPLDKSPAKRLPNHYHGEPRDRALTIAEIVALLPLLNNPESPLPLGFYGRMNLLLTLATGARSGELLKLRWSDVDRDAGVFSIRSEIGKSGRTRQLPISAFTAEILDRLEETRQSDVLFPGGNDPNVPLRQLAVAVGVRRFFPKRGRDKVPQPHMGLSPFTPHDLRRTARTHWQRLGISELVGESLLGHSLGSKIFLTYATHNFADEQRQALDAWSTELYRLRDGAGADAANVVSIASRRAIKV
jgi:integrase